METSTTTMSTNGQIVIPSKVRKHIQASPGTKFTIMTHGKDLILKQMDETRMLEENAAFMRSIRRAEEDIKHGRFIEIKNISKYSVKELDDILMGKKKGKKF